MKKNPSKEKSVLVVQFVMERAGMVDICTIRKAEIARVEHPAKRIGDKYGTAKKKRKKKKRSGNIACENVQYERKKKRGGRGVVVM
jgi:hypothetical protein